MFHDPLALSMSQTAKATHLPTIDFAAFAQGTSSTRQAIAEQLYQACQSVGFFYCRNLGISPPLIQQAFAQSQLFFDLPQTVKDVVAWSHGESNRGYVGLGRESLNPQQPGDLKEAFNVGQEVPQIASSDASVVTPQNQWPAGQDSFQKTTLQFYQACSSAVETLFEAFALALQLPHNFFCDRHLQQDYTLRLLHYPPLIDAPVTAQIRAGEHSDYGSLTLLFQDEVGGLEVQTAEGDWVVAAPIPDTVVVNVGDLMQRWTNDVFRSAVHRVQLPQQQQGPRSRYSIAFFCQPDFDVEVACLAACQGGDRPPRYATVRSGEYLLNRLQATYEWVASSKTPI